MLSYLNKNKYYGWATNTKYVVTDWVNSKVIVLSQSIDGSKQIIIEPWGELYTIEYIISLYLIFNIR